jgi:hypothetical protein
VEEHLPSKNKALSSNPGTAKKKKKINDFQEGSNKQMNEAKKS